MPTSSDNDHSGEMQQPECDLNTSCCLNPSNDQSNYLRTKNGPVRSLGLTHRRALLSS